jgi:hypothetical protein
LIFSAVFWPGAADVNHLLTLFDESDGRCAMALPGFVKIVGRHGGLGVELVDIGHAAELNWALA